VTFYLDVDDSPGREPYLRVDLAGPGPVPTGTTQDVRYMTPVPIAAAVGPADLRTGRLMFADVPRDTENEFGTGRALRPNPALPTSVSGSIEWSCGDEFAPTPMPGTMLPLRTTSVHVVMGADSITTTPRQAPSGTIVFDGDAPLHGDASPKPLGATELWVVGPLTDAHIELLKSGNAYWRSEYSDTPGDVFQHWQLGGSPRQVHVAPGRYGVFTVDWVTIDGVNKEVATYALLTIVP
jgi:hypothetical protein